MLMRQAHNNNIRRHNVKHGSNENVPPSVMLSLKRKMKKHSKRRKKLNNAA